MQEHKEAVMGERTAAREAKHITHAEASRIEASTKELIDWQKGAASQNRETLNWSPIAESDAGKLLRLRSTIDDLLDQRDKLTAQRDELLAAMRRIRGTASQWACNRLEAAPALENIGDFADAALAVVEK